MQQHGLLLHVPHAPGVRRLALAAALVLGTAVLGIAALLRRRAEPRHVLVIDAGSSGTRMYAYTWQEGGDDGMPLVVALPASAAPRRVPRRAVPGKRAYQRVETEPGLDRFVGDATGLQAKALGKHLHCSSGGVDAVAHNARCLCRRTAVGLGQGGGTQQVVEAHAGLPVRNGRIAQAQVSPAVLRASAVVEKTC